MRIVPQFNKFAFYFGAGMSLVYILLGLFLLIGKSNNPVLPFPYKIIFGALLVIYGCFRIVRYWKSNSSNLENDKES